MPKNKIKIMNKSMNRSMIKNMCVSRTGVGRWAHTHTGERKRN